jgi:hypothetical protein
LRATPRSCSNDAEFGLLSVIFFVSKLGWVFGLGGSQNAYVDLGWCLAIFALTGFCFGWVIWLADQRFDLVFGIWGRPARVLSIDLVGDLAHRPTVFGIWGVGRLAHSVIALGKKGDGPQPCGTCWSSGCACTASTEFINTNENIPALVENSVHRNVVDFVAGSVRTLASTRFAALRPLSSTRPSLGLITC